MPAATPLPGYPSALTTYSAVDLLTMPGCPLCHYVGRANARYLTWFALEGHGDMIAITRLTRSLGMCGKHTRQLMGQPGAGQRLTAVYRYLLTEAIQQLGGQRRPSDQCPMCEHDESATSRALDTLLEGLADQGIRERCRELGGLCVPHFGAAVAAGSRKIVGWLDDLMAATLLSGSISLRLLAGEAGHDAEVRAVLRRSLPEMAYPGSYVCAACLAGAAAETEFLASLARLTNETRSLDNALLCPEHLQDTAQLIGADWRQRSLLAWQAHCHVQAASALRHPIFRDARMRVGVRRRRQCLAACIACDARSLAASRALTELSGTLRTSPGLSGQPTALCVRHVLNLRRVSPRAGQLAASTAGEVAEQLRAELAEAFSKNTAARRDEPKGPEATAWRRAAAFMDGSIYCGSAPAGEHA